MLTPSASQAQADLTVPHLVRAAAEHFGTQPAVVTDAETVSYGQLSDRVAEAAAAFLSLGVRRGDRVALWGPNSLNWIVACLGLQCAGGVLVPISTRYRGEEVRHILDRSGACALVTVSRFLDVDYLALLRSAAGGASPGRPVGGLQDLRHVVLLDDQGASDALAWRTFLDRAQSASSELGERLRSVAPGDNMDLMFTSGTTGRPKGVLMTHEQNLATYRIFSNVIQFERGDRYLIVNPFFHAFGYKAGIISSLLMGMTIYPHDVFDAERVMREIEQHKITVFPAPPTVYQMLLDHPAFPNFDLSSLRVSITGAASAPMSLIARLRREMSFEHIHVGWGLTEACGVGTMTRAGDPPEKISGTTGPALYPELELRIVDQDGKTLPAGGAGEVLLRGMSVMKAYFDDDEATSAALDADGWLRTGDIGVLDNDGYLSITDRKKDMYIVGGFNAYPAEIENIISSHPKISQVAVVGVPDIRLGEVGVAFVVLRPGERLAEAELIAWCRDNMANFKAPRRVCFRSELPLNASNKVLKHELRKEASAWGGDMPDGAGHADRTDGDRI